MSNVLRNRLYARDLQLTPALCRAFFMHVFRLNCPSLSTLGDWAVVVVVVVFVLYLLSERSYSPETPAGDLHALEQPRANQVHFSARERNKHAGNKHAHAENLRD